MATKTTGLDRLKAKIARLPENAKKAMRAVNLDAAQRQWGGARIALVRGPPEGGHLEDTLVIEKGQTETGYLVRVGGPGHPYPLHLEAGHKAPDGSHVPPNPFWYPTRRRVLKQHKAKLGKVLKTVIDQSAR